MKLYVNLYNLYDGKEFLHTDKVYKEDDKFFMEFGDIKFDIPSKNGMVKCGKGNSINLDDKSVDIFKSILK